MNNPSEIHFEFGEGSVDYTLIDGKKVDYKAEVKWRGRVMHTTHDRYPDKQRASWLYATYGVMQNTFQLNKCLCGTVTKQKNGDYTCTEILKQQSK